jgi:hypothetical protein
MSLKRILKTGILKASFVYLCKSVFTSFITGSVIIILSSCSAKMEKEAAIIDLSLGDFNAPPDVGTIGTDSVRQLLANGAAKPKPFILPEGSYILTIRAKGTLEYGIFPIGKIYLGDLPLKDVTLT